MSENKDPMVASIKMEIHYRYNNALHLPSFFNYVSYKDPMIYCIAVQFEWHGNAQTQ